MKVVIDIHALRDIIEDFVIEMSTNVLPDILDELIGDNVLDDDRDAAVMFVSRLIERSCAVGLITAASLYTYMANEVWADRTSDVVLKYVTGYLEEHLTYERSWNRRVVSVSEQWPEALWLQTMHEVHTVGELISDLVVDTLAMMSIFDDPDANRIIEDIDVPFLKLMDRSILSDDELIVDLDSACVVVYVKEK